MNEIEFNELITNETNKILKMLKDDKIPMPIGEFILFQALRCTSRVLDNFNNTADDTDLEKNYWEYRRETEPSKGYE